MPCASRATASQLGFSSAPLDIREAEFLCLATGYVYGFLPAIALMLVLWPASCILAYWLARRFGRPLVERLVDRRAIEWATGRIAKASAGTLLLLRVIPIVPYNVVSYPSGMFGVRSHALLGPLRWAWLRN
jgi:uncharacterized membrane protein YdjX (TVP38/TMEM64 family)